MTRSRITGIGGASVAGFTQVQARLAESDAELGCATRLFEALVAGLDGDGDAHARRDRAYMAHLALDAVTRLVRSEEHTSELQSLMRISYAVFCLKKKIE